MGYALQLETAPGNPGSTVVPDAPSETTTRKPPPLLQILFRLAAKAPGLGPAAMMARLCTAIANHYGAVACSLHTNESGWPDAAAEPIRAVRKMKPLDRARRETIEASLVQAVFRDKSMLSALDLENREDVEAFLQRTLGVIDIFAFPLRVEGEIQAVLVIYLSLVSDPLGESDLCGLHEAGELIALAGSPQHLR